MTPDPRRWSSRPVPLEGVQPVLRHQTVPGAGFKAGDQPVGGGVDTAVGAVRTYVPDKIHGRGTDMREAIAQFHAGVGHDTSRDRFPLHVNDPLLQINQNKRRARAGHFFPHDG